MAEINNMPKLTTNEKIINEAKIWIAEELDSANRFTDYNRNDFVMFLYDLEEVLKGNLEMEYEIDEEGKTVQSTWSVSSGN